MTYRGMVETLIAQHEWFGMWYSSTVGSRYNEPLSTLKNAAHLRQGADNRRPSFTPTVRGGEHSKVWPAILDGVTP